MSLPRSVLVAFALATVVPTHSALADPAIDYMLHCRGCHGPNGEGAPPDVPDLRGTVATFLGLAGGREYLIRVPGSAQAELSDARTAALLTWMVRAYDPANIPPDFEPFTAGEVAHHRRTPLADAAAARAAILERRWRGSAP